LNNQFDRNFFDNTPKQLLQMGPEQVASGTISSDGPLTEFTAVIMVCPRQPGILFSCTTQGQGASFSVSCRANGDIYVTQQYSGTIQETDTLNAVSLWAHDVFDGYRHSIAFSCSGTNRDIYIDGDLIDSARSGSIDDSNASDTPTLNSVKIGGVDPESGSAFAGDVFSVGLWQYQMTNAEIRRASFGFLNGFDLDMLGFWSMNGTLEDLSVNGHDLTLNQPPAKFLPTVQSYWGNTPARPFRMSDHGKQFPDYLLYHIDGIANTSIDANTPVVSDHAINIASCDLLFGALTGRGSQLYAPDSVVVTLTGPGGTVYNTESATDTLLVRMRAGGLRAFVVKSPQRGKWRIRITAPASASYTFQVQALPAGGSDTIFRARDLALRPIVMGLDADIQDRQRTLSEGGGGLWWLWRVGAVAVAGLVLVATLPADIVIAPLVLAVLVGVAKAADLDAQHHVQQMNRTDNVTSCTQTADYIVKNNTRKGILMIDAANKSPTGEPGQNADRIYQARKNVVFPRLFSGAGEQYDARFLAAQQVTRANVEKALADRNIVYVSVTGHGQVDQLLGWTVPGSNDRLETVLDTTVAASLVQGKIFHFLACKIGRSYVGNNPNMPGLARKLYQLGATATIGYVSSYDIGTPFSLPQDMCEADGEIDRVLIEGGTVAEAVKAAQDKYQKLINSYDKDTIKERMRTNASMLFVYGNGNAKL
jgi:hypothetical protein